MTYFNESALDFRSWEFKCLIDEISLYFYYHHYLTMGTVQWYQPKVLIELLICLTLPNLPRKSKAEQTGVTKLQGISLGILVYNKPLDWSPLYFHLTYLDMRRKQAQDWLPPKGSSGDSRGSCPRVATQGPLCTWSLIIQAPPWTTLDSPVAATPQPWPETTSQEPAPSGWISRGPFFLLSWRNSSLKETWFC